MVSDLLIAVCGLLRCMLNFISSPLSDNTTTTATSNSNSNSHSNSTEPANTSGVGVGGGGGEGGSSVSCSQKILEGGPTHPIDCVVSTHLIDSLSTHPINVNTILIACHHTLLIA